MVETRRCAEEGAVGGVCARSLQVDGVEVMEMTPGEFTGFVKTDFEKWRGLAREADIVIE